MAGSGSGEASFCAIDWGREEGDEEVRIGYRQRRTRGEILIGMSGCRYMYEIVDTAWSLWISEA